uniref:Chondrolectin n=1 Tax=Oncorhynchus mykiss TaxID=8022 RepID=A0A8K9WRF5_ONCMY
RGSLLYYFLSAGDRQMDDLLLVTGQTVCQGGAEHPCYKMAYFRDMTSRVAFWEARKACEMDGGSLLSIENAAEQRHIEHLLQVTDGDFWIGLTRTDGENTQEQDHFASCPDLYRWTDGSVSQFRKWYFDEPSCGGEACVVMYHQPTALHGLGGAYMYQWNDDRCNMKHNFICKYEPGTTTHITQVRLHSITQVRLHRITQVRLHSITLVRLHSITQVRLHRITQV